MDVLLLNLADMVGENLEEKEYNSNQTAMPPLGLLYLAQVLVDNGYVVKVYDQNVTGVKNEVLIDTIVKKNNPMIIGLSVCLHNYWTASDLIKRVRLWNPNCVLVAGNYIATFYPEQFMKENDVDFCIRGEGEYAFLELVNLIMKKKQTIDNIKGLVFRERNVIKSNQMGRHIENVDALPIPDRKLIDFNYRLQHKSTAIITSRGCPFGCTFCYFDGIMGKKWRPRSVKSVVDELVLLKSEGYKDILIGDSIFTLNKNRTFQLCAEIKKNYLDEMTFSADARIDVVNYNILRSLAQVNFIQILFGIESGNQRILDYYHKGIKLEQIKNAVKTANKARLESITGTFILGAPDETLQEMINTIRFANELELSFVVFQILNTIPISPIYQDMVAKGYYKPRDDDWKRSIHVVDVSPEAVPKKHVVKLMNEGFVHFWTNPRRMLKMVLNTFTRDAYLRYAIGLINGPGRTRRARP
nr:radical SAM protein [Candidatus Sigynarchaeota archaeon]